MFLIDKKVLIHGAFIDAPYDELVTENTRLWSVASQGKLKSYRFSEQQSLAGDGYDALVRAQETLLKRLAEAISASLPAAGQVSG